ncbi:MULTISPECIES: quinone oxidoreductase [unclassified Azospirillum]|uniref:quinone oxidoreductase family protein n=1 Tax=unclassified Azospirillum TaxID=2630922 RepID=UPI000B65E563|nr:MULTISPECIES: quinone oxidoreductase [unclassified Azospirillum]SNS62084.1 NADPH2:quinone reductase [Azospirillum sp. RU38E]SNS81304.1 NADPH2:quinone reductase [Azospirillum sp. RU37A]
MTHAIRVHSHGGPETLRWEPVTVGQPAAGEVLIEHKAVGLNFIDVYFRTGLYPAPLPFTPGMEGAGVVLAVGPGVDYLAPGDRVGYGNSPLGAYAEQRLIPADRLIKLPDWLDDETAAAMLLQGLTAQYLLRQTYVVKPGDTILIHAAAGGVGLLVCQWAKALGATVIGTVGSAEKAALAQAHGCHHTILYRQEDVVARVRELTGSKGVDVVYDSIGKDMFDRSLDCLKRRGLMVSFGNASGPVPPVDISILNKKGGLFITRPSLGHYAGTRDEMLAMADDLFAVVKDGTVKVNINQRFALQDAAEAHRALESRATTGATVLVV